MFISFVTLVPSDVLFLVSVHHEERMRERERQRERERERETGDCRDRRGVRDKEVEKGCKDSSISLPAQSIWT